MPRGRMMRADQVKTGDVILPPTSNAERVVQHVRTYRDVVELRYTKSASAEIPLRTLVRVHRKTRRVNRDAAEEIVHTSQGETS